MELLPMPVTWTCAESVDVNPSSDIPVNPPKGWLRSHQTPRFSRKCKWLRQASTCWCVTLGKSLNCCHWLLLSSKTVTLLLCYSVYLSALAYTSSKYTFVKKIWSKALVPQPAPPAIQKQPTDRPHYPLQCIITGNEDNWKQDGLSPSVLSRR